MGPEQAAREWLQLQDWHRSHDYYKSVSEADVVKLLAAYAASRPEVERLQQELVLCRGTKRGKELEFEEAERLLGSMTYPEAIGGHEMTLADKVQRVQRRAEVAEAKLAEVERLVRAARRLDELHVKECGQCQKNPRRCPRYATLAEALKSFPEVPHGT